MLVEPFVDRGGKYRQVEAGAFKKSDPFRRCERAHNDDRPSRPSLNQQLARVREGTSGGEHGIENDAGASSQSFRQFVDVGLWLEGSFVARDADEANIGRRHEFLRSMHKAESCTKNRHDHRLIREHVPRRCSDRRFDRDFVGRQAASCLGEQQHTDSL